MKKVTSDNSKSQYALPIRKAKGELAQVIVLRLPPGADIYKTVEEVARSEEITSGLILSGLGSLEQITLRNVRLTPKQFPIKDRHRIYNPKAEPMELLSLTGNISTINNRIHIHAHAVVSSGLEEARVYGGHLLKGCIVLSTAEIVLCCIRGIRMIREMDEQTRVLELFCSSDKETLDVS
jgi:predicted DNA-binding protein with PD1-like motif